MVNAASPAYLAGRGVPLSLEDLQRQGHRAIHFARTLGAKPCGWEYPDGDSYATLQLPGALYVNSVQTYEAAGVAGLGAENSGATVGDWPLLGEWSVDRASTRFSAQAARRLPGRSASAQPIAPCPRIHEMDRKCARALPRIAKTNSSAVQKSNLFEQRRAVERAALFRCKNLIRKSAFLGVLSRR